MPFQAWQPPWRAALQLTAVTRRLQTLTEQATAGKNRGRARAATAASSTVVVADVKRSLRAIEKGQARLARAAEKIIAGDEPLQRRYQLLRTVPGVGETSALQRLGELVLVPANADVRAVGGLCWFGSAGGQFRVLVEEADADQQGGQSACAPGLVHAGSDGRAS